MKMVILAGAVVSALVSMSAARAQSCSANCSAQHSTCARSGKDYGTCMGVWRQCKAACLTPARGAAAAPKAVATVARR